MTQIRDDLRAYAAVYPWTDEAKKAFYPAQVNAAARIDLGRMPRSYCLREENGVPDVRGLTAQGTASRSVAACQAL